MAAEEGDVVGAAAAGADSAAEEVDSVGEGAVEGGAASEGAVAAAVGAGVVALEAVVEADLEGGADFEINVTMYDLLCKSIFIIHRTIVKSNECLMLLFGIQFIGARRRSRSFTDA